MALDNLIEVEFTAEEIRELEECMTKMENILKKKTINLSNEERQQYGRIGEKNKLLVDKCKTYMELNPTSVPPTLDKAEFDKDYKARTQIDPMSKRISYISTMLSDIKIMLDYDNYNAAVGYYRYVKFLASQNAPGMTAVYEDLKVHYQYRTTATEPLKGNSEAAATPSEGSERA